jgi:hypothetical protein
LAKYYIDWDTHRRPPEELYSLIGKKVVIHELYRRGEPRQGTLIKIYEDPDNHGSIDHGGAFSFILGNPKNQDWEWVSYDILIKMIETIE